MPLDALISTRSPTVAIIGLGYVGLPLAHAFSAAGIKTIGFDIDPKKIEALDKGTNYLRHLGDDFVRAMKSKNLFSATTDFSRLAEPDAILICVPTPLTKHLEPDLSFIEKTAAAVAKTLRKDQLIVLESTTYPGTTRDILLPRLRAAHPALIPGEDYFVAFSPEREDPGRVGHTTATIPKLVGGLDPASTRLAAALYRLAIKEVIPVESAEVAEAAKLLENIYRAVNIAMVNELKVLFDAMNIDIWQVIEAAKTKPFGFHPFYPGPGLGGHCIPIDPFYLTHKAREVGLPTRFIELAGQINHDMPAYVVGRLTRALNDRNRPVNGSRILVLGLAYKPDIDDVRESPSLELIEQLKDLGAEVDYHDPHIPATHQMRKYNLNMRSVPLTPQSLQSYHAVLISTAHKAVDYPMIAAHANLILDTRNAMHPFPEAAAKVIKA